MPRCPRILSSTGVYHVMMRGINRGDLFIDGRDREKFLEIMQTTGSLGEYDVYAYCLMSNHVHLLIKEAADPIDRTMKRIGISYSQYFNNRNERVGHVFQDRFRSETVENERYLLGCIRYIHNNPVKAGIVKQPEYYGWSSYCDYIGKGKSARGITSTSFVLGIFSDNTEKAVQVFREFSRKEDEKGKFIDYHDEYEKLPKEILNKKVSSIIGKHGLDLKGLRECNDKAKRDEVLNELKNIKGVSLRGLAEILSIGKNVIHKA